MTQAVHWKLEKYVWNGSKDLNTTKIFSNKHIFFGVTIFAKEDIIFFEQVQVKRIRI